MTFDIDSDAQALADATLMMNTLNQSYAVIMDSLGGELMPEPV